MSYKSGQNALNLCPQDIVPRTEYSAHFHWDLVKKVTGIDTDCLDLRPQASKQFIKDWDYAMMWNLHVLNGHLERYGKISRMGHASYSETADGHSDMNNQVSVLFDNIDDALKLDSCKFFGEFDCDELVQEYNSFYAQAQKDYPDTLNMDGVYINTVSGLTFVYGWEMLLELIAYPEFDKVIENYQEWLMQFYVAFAKSDVPVFMYHDDICWTSGNFASKEWYMKNVFRYTKKYMDILKSAGKKIIYTSDGNYSMFYDEIVRCGADMLVFEPGSDMEGFARKYGKTHGFVGDVDTRVLLLGDKSAIEKEVQRVMNFGKKYDGFILAVGNHIPPNTPVDNALYYNEVYEKLKNK